MAAFAARWGDAEANVAKQDAFQCLPPLNASPNGQRPTVQTADGTRYVNPFESRGFECALPIMEADGTAPPSTLREEHLLRAVPSTRTSECAYSCRARKRRSRRPARASRCRHRRRPGSRRRRCAAPRGARWRHRPRRRHHRRLSHGRPRPATRYEIRRRAYSGKIDTLR